VIIFNSCGQAQAPQCNFLLFPQAHHLQDPHHLAQLLLLLKLCLRNLAPQALLGLLAQRVQSVQLDHKVFKEWLAQLAHKALKEILGQQDRKVFKAYKANKA
jgi:hypothetical protein